MYEEKGCGKGRFDPEVCKIQPMGGRNAKATARQLNRPGTRSVWIYICMVSTTS